MAKEKLQSLGRAGRQLLEGVRLTYDMLVGDGQWATTEQQIQLAQGALTHVRDVALWAWEKVDTGSEFAGSYIKVIQGAGESYADFVGRLTNCIEKQVRDDSTRKLLLRQLAFDNANEDCQAVIRPIKEREDLLGYLKACRNIGTFKHRARLAAMETFAVQKQMKAKCFNCGKPGHFRKQCRAPPLIQRDSTDAGYSTSPGICPRCRRGRHWAKDCRSRTDRDGQLLQPGNSQRGQPQAPNNQGFAAHQYPVQFAPIEP